MNLKLVSLAILILQNSSLVLVMRYSKTVASGDYITSTAVVSSEIMKLIASLILYYFEIGAQNIPIDKFFNQVNQNLFGIDSKWKEMTVPAILYFIQNNLQYVAVGNLDAATFQVTYQMKIITTAIFSVLILRRSLSSKKWLSLLLLTMGIGLVQITNGSTRVNTQESSNHFIGLFSVGIACVLSGVAGVW